MSSHFFFTQRRKLVKRVALFSWVSSCETWVGHAHLKSTLGVGEPFLTLGKRKNAADDTFFLPYAYVVAVFRS